MTDYIVYHFVSGLAFFSGAALLVGGVGLSLVLQGRAGRIAAHLLAVIGLILAALSATPMPLWSFAGMVLLTVVWLVAEGGRSHFGRRPLLASSGALIAFVVGCVLVELPYQLPPAFPGLDAQTIYVIGDSISAGVGTCGETLWPDVLGQRKVVNPVVNLARAGATCSSAFAQARKVPERSAVVLLEIGGNDLLGRGDAAAFRRALEALLQELAQGDRLLVMFELPLPPLHAEFGRIQRELASKYGVYLIPKRYFARIILTPGDTLDGLHLSRAGHEQMAETVRRLLANR